jgi:transcription antitermination factor NusG
MANWRVFYTAPRAELRTEERLAGQGIETFVPRCKVLRRWSDRRQWVTEPLFASYLFARVDEGARLRTLQTPGIVRCLSFGGRLAKVDDAEIDQLRLTQADRERLAPYPVWHPPVGEMVEVVAGPFAGLRGEVIEHRSQSSLIVRVNTIRQAVRVRLPAESVLTLGAANTFVTS